MYARLVLSNLRVEERFEALAVCSSEGDRGSDVEIVQKVGNVEKN
jgi:hypothetical protein